MVPARTKGWYTRIGTTVMVLYGLTSILCHIWKREVLTALAKWWLAEREWYTGTRDYWKVVTKSGDRLWLYFAHGGLVTGGWFCHGRFA